jgi:single-stranded DNA-binding protein
MSECIGAHPIAVHWNAWGCTGIPREEGITTHLNKQLLPGRISARGPKLTYNSAGTPICSFTVEIDKPGKDGKVYTSFHTVEITGRYAEPCAEQLEPGDEILVEGEHQYRSSVDPKTKEKRTRCVLSTWGVSQRTPASVGTAPAIESPN